MAPTFQSLKSEYGRLWTNMIINPAKLKLVDQSATRVLAGKARYQAVEKRNGVPWFVVGIIHKMEADLDWNANIAQGDPWRKVSVNVPRGRGPFKSWEDAAVDALSIDDTDMVHDWSAERLAYELEKYNGWGYRSKGIWSPYLWSYSNHYVRGKYVSDGKWSSTAVSSQAGAMPILKRMMDLDKSVSFQQPAPIPPKPVETPKPIEAKTSGSWISNFIKSLFRKG